MTSYVPLWSGKVGNSKYMQGRFVYEKEPDQIRCPAGKILTLGRIDERYKRYSSSVSDCRACEQSATCTAARPKRSDKRFILRNVDQELFEEVTAQMDDPTFKQKMSERMWKIEGLFVEAKDNHGLARARYRGRAKVQIQAYLTATVQNLKRLVFLFLLLLQWTRIQNQKVKQRTRFNFSNLNLFNTPDRLMRRRIECQKTLKCQHWHSIGNSSPFERSNRRSFECVRIPLPSHCSEIASRRFLNSSD